MTRAGCNGAFPRFLIAFLAVALAGRTLVACPQIDEVTADVRTLAEAYIRDDISPGLVIALRSGETTWIEAFGTSDIGIGNPLMPEHQFLVGSIAKQFTAAAVLRLVEEGRADLDAPISSCLPEAPESWSGITLRQLLNHTSGICSYGNMPFDLGGGALGSEAVFGFIAATDVVFAPGEDWVYSTAAYSVLAYAVERITGEAFEAFVEREFLEPLGMAKTGYRMLREPEHLAGYHFVYWQGEAMFDDPPDDVLGLGAGMYSTVSDLLVWEAALRSGRVVSETTLAEMTMPTETGPAVGGGVVHDYGLGLELRFDEGGVLTKVGHAGTAGGHIGVLWSYPVEDRVLIVLQNSNGMLPPLLEEIEATLQAGCRPESP